MNILIDYALRRVKCFIVHTKRKYIPILLKSTLSHNAFCLKHCEIASPGVVCGIRVTAVSVDRRACRATCTGAAQARHGIPRPSDWGPRRLAFRSSLRHCSLLRHACWHSKHYFCDDQCNGRIFFVHTHSVHHNIKLHSSYSCNP